MSKSRRQEAVVEVGFGATEEVAPALARNFERAILRIGGPNPRKRARWLVETFLANDPAALTPGEVLTRQEELGALVFMAVREGTLNGADMTISDNPADLHPIWKGLRDSVHRWIGGEPIAMEMVATFQRRPGPGNDIRGERSKAKVVGLQNAALFAALDLLADSKVRLGTCPECHKLFVPERRQKRHPKCARQARDINRPDRGKRKPKKGGK
jgi:hypothetical protein